MDAGLYSWERLGVSAARLFPGRRVVVRDSANVLLAAEVTGRCDPKARTVTVRLRGSDQLQPWAAVDVFTDLARAVRRQQVFDVTGI